MMIKGLLSLLLVLFGLSARPCLADDDDEESEEAVVEEIQEPATAEDKKEIEVKKEPKTKAEEEDNDEVEDIPNEATAEGTEDEEGRIPPMAKPSEATKVYDQGHRFGSNYVYLGLARPSFSSLDHYDTLYKSQSVMPVFGISYAFMESPFYFGWGWSVGYYTNSGKTAKKVNGTVVRDTTSTTLTMIPLGLWLHSSYDVTNSILMNLKFGFESLYYQEVRDSDVATDSKNGSKSFFTSGSNGSMLLGFSMDFNINAFEGKSRSSMKVMGYKATYLSPFFEVASKVTSTSLLGRQGKTNFSRATLGLLCTFEGK